MHTVNITSAEIIIFVILGVWSLFWKALALWHAARGKQGVWFIIFVILNSAGILEIVYLFAIRKIKPGKLFAN